MDLYNIQGIADAPNGDVSLLASALLDLEVHVDRLREGLDAHLAYMATLENRIEDLEAKLANFGWPDDNTTTRFGRIG